MGDIRSLAPDMTARQDWTSSAAIFIQVMIDSERSRTCRDRSKSKSILALLILIPCSDSDKVILNKAVNIVR
jgi:hypothetical protein